MLCWKTLVMAYDGIETVALLKIPRQHEGDVVVRGYPIPRSGDWDNDERDEFAAAMEAYTEEATCPKSESRCTSGQELEK